MKRIIYIALFGSFLLAQTACGSGGCGCDSYHKSDYTKYKSEQTKSAANQVEKIKK